MYGALYAVVSHCLFVLSFYLNAPIPMLGAYSIFALSSAVIYAPKTVAATSSMFPIGRDVAFFAGLWIIILWKLHQVFVPFRSNSLIRT